MKYQHPWPPISPQDEKKYNIELKDGTIVENVEYWSFGGGFQPTQEREPKRSKYVDYELSDVVSFSLSNSQAQARPAFPDAECSEQPTNETK
jgi:hypothetical protein